jgi:hypothetical protein
MAWPICTPLSDPQQLWVVYFNSPLTYTQEQKLHIEYTIGRDVRPDQLDDMINTLTRWCVNHDVYEKAA